MIFGRIPPRPPPRGSRPPLGIALPLLTAAPLSSYPLSSRSKHSPNPYDEMYGRNQRDISSWTSRAVLPARPWIPELLPPSSVARTDQVFVQLGVPSFLLPTYLYPCQSLPSPPPSFAPELRSNSRTSPLGSFSGTRKKKKKEKRKKTRKRRRARKSVARRPRVLSSPSNQSRPSGSPFPSASG